MKQLAQNDKKVHILIRASVAVIDPIALRKAKIVCNFGLSECNRVKVCGRLIKILLYVLMQTKEIDIDCCCKSLKILLVSGLFFLVPGP